MRDENHEMGTRKKSDTITEINSLKLNFAANETR